MSDPDTTYRTKAEIEDYKKNKDCIDLVKRVALENSLAAEQDFLVQASFSIYKLIIL